MRTLLVDLGIPYTDAPRLVRGLDYYTRTTYEFDHALLGAQSGIGGGGRYDGLSEEIGGPPLPGIGFAVGLDRIVLAVESERAGAVRPAAAACQVFGVPLGEDAHADVLTLITSLRRAGIRADMAFGARGLKGAMKAADRSGADYALLIGADERTQRDRSDKRSENRRPAGRGGNLGHRLADRETGDRRTEGRAMIRTHEAGTLRGEHAGETVVLAGWVARRRDHGGVVFIDLRDASGTVQVVWRSDDEAAHDLRAEYCVTVTGVVRSRPAGNENPELPTGAIEVVADTLDVLSEADPLPFPVEGTSEISEDVRIKYRYLDIRREEMSRALRVRSDGVLPAVRRDARPRLRERGDAVPDQVHARGRARLRRPGPAPPGQLVRAAAVAAAVQAAAHGRRPRAVLPARPLLPRRGLRARTGSRSSPRSTSRCRSSPART